MLSVIYSWTVTLALQPILERALKTEISSEFLWAATCSLLLIPAFIEFAPLGQLPLRKGLFSESIWSKLGGPLSPLYLRHEFRRGATWLMLALCTVGSSLLPPRKFALSVLIALLLSQRALFSIQNWRRLAQTRFPEHGAFHLIRAMALSQSLQSILLWLALGLAQVYSQEQWLALGPAFLACAWISSTLCLEGDSGRPYLVNLIALSGGIIAGYACMAHWGFLALVAVICRSLYKGMGERLKAVENLDEDALIP